MGLEDRALRFELRPMIGDTSGTVHVLFMTGEPKPLATICTYDDTIAQLIVAALNVTQSHKALLEAVREIELRKVAQRICQEHGFPHPDDAVTQGQTKDDEATK